MFEKYLKTLYQLYQYIPVFGKTGAFDISELLNTTSLQIPPLDSSDRISLGQRVLFGPHRKFLNFHSSQLWHTWYCRRRCRQSLCTNFDCHVQQYYSMWQTILHHRTNFLHITNLQCMPSCRDLCCYDAIRFVAIHALLCGAKILSTEQKWQIWCMSQRHSVTTNKQRRRSSKKMW